MFIWWQAIIAPAALSLVFILGGIAGWIKNISVDGAATLFFVLAALSIPIIFANIILGIFAFIAMSTLSFSQWLYVKKMGANK